MLDEKEWELDPCGEDPVQDLSAEELLNDILNDPEFAAQEQQIEEEEPVEVPEVIPEVIPKATKIRKRKKKEEELPLDKSILLYLHDLVFLLAAVIVVFLLCFRVVVVSGTSMNSTLLDGDYLLLIGDLFYREPQRGDVIVASKDSFDNGAPIVKRVIATEGQTVDIDFRAGIVYVDGVALDEPYTMTPTNLEEGVKFPVTVSEGCIFVMGDNRNGSKDSRNPEIGMIDKREVLGKVVFLFLPGTNGTNYWGEPNEHRDFDRIGVVS